MPDADRELLLDHAELVCPRCGNLREVCSDPEVGYYPQRDVCYSTAAHELTMRRLKSKHKDNEPGPDEFHPLDGVRVWMSAHNLTPDDKFV